MYTLPIYNVNTKSNSFAQFKMSQYAKHTPLGTSKSIADWRVKTYERDISYNDKIKALIGTTIGTAIPVLMMMKKQKIKNPFKLKYDMSDMVKVSAGSIIGGVGLGLINEEEQVKKDRLKEGLFQFMNAVVPTYLVGLLIKLCETSTKHNNKTSKLLSVAGGLIFGMFGSAALANLITDPMDKHPDRKVTVKDALVNIDDGLGALVLAKVPIVEKFNLGGFLPLIYASCGYRAGKSN